MQELRVVAVNRVLDIDHYWPPRVNKDRSSVAPLP